MQPMGERSKLGKIIYDCCGEELCRRLELRGVEVDRESRCINAYFISEGPLEEEQEEVVARALREACGAEVRVHIADNSFSPDRAQSALLQDMLKERPFYARLMESARWKFSQERVEIYLEASRGMALSRAGIDRYIQEKLLTLFNRRCAVAFCPQTEEEEKDVLDEYIQRRDKLEEELAVPKLMQREVSAVQPNKDDAVIFGGAFNGQKTDIKSVDELTGRVILEGDILSVKQKALKNGKKTLFLIDITDYTSSITVTLFVKNSKKEEVKANLDSVKRICVQGDCVYDKFAGEIVITAKSIIKAESPKEFDNAPEKRVELHLHTRMSEMDSVVSPSELIKLAKAYGHDAIAVTDHGVVQAYPDLEAAISKQKADIKLIFGVEGYLFDDGTPMLALGEQAKLSELTYVVFDIETTGLESQRDQILEIGAVKIKNGEYVGKFSTFVDPKCNIPEKIVKLTNINNSMVMGAPSQEEAVRDFLEFAKGTVLVAHNAAFDTSFIKFASNKFGLGYDNVSLDTLALARLLLPQLKSHKLNKLCDYYKIKLEGHHRAVNDAEATASLLLKLLEQLDKDGIITAGDLNRLSGEKGTGTGDTYHIVLYAKNKTGLFNLYQLITMSHLDYFFKRSRMPRSQISRLREGLIIGSACEAGELFRAVLSKASDAELEKIASFYDFLEVQPIGNNQFLVREGIVKDEEELRELNKRIIALGERLNKPVVATGDVHFLRKRDAVFRTIIQNAKGYSDADNQGPMYYRTTQEMLDEFDYLPEEKRKEIVITNTRMIADMCEKMESFPRDRLYTPKMEGAEEEISQMVMQKAHETYGDPLPEIVKKRLDKELTAIIKHGFAVLYLIAHKVVAKSLSDGYLVGSRGSVGSSLAATMADITEVNPLPPHYVCPNCKYSDFDVDIEKYGCGLDLPKRNCPVCGEPLSRQGFDIPFEVFMGFEGDKVPDIDLNFSGVYQPVIHKYIEELFGSSNVFRAGTIGGVKEKIAIGYVLKYCEEHNVRFTKAEQNRLAQGCVKVKRTTGQHPGGIVVLPKEYQIYEFTPLQYPANDKDKGIITTHFDFNSLHDTLLKLDILGHDDPTTIRMLERLTGLNAREIPLDDPQTLSLWLSTDALGVTPEQIGTSVGTYGIPEMGTNFVRKMLIETKPTTFADLLRISGLSHGTDVWANNAQVLVQQGKATLPELICTREDIMNRLLQKGVPSKIAFKTMETVRKGRPMTEEMIEAIKGTDLPEWFLDSCQKINYMFPKAHAAAYVTMAIRIAYFKVHYPVAFYLAYFTVRADDFEINLMQGGAESIKDRIKELYDQPNLNPREKGILTMLEIALEMKMRGIDFADIDIYKSEATEFTVDEENKIRPPLTALAGLGEAAAQAIVDARADGEFSSQEDLISRTKISKSVLEVLLNNGCLKGMSQSEQIMFFDLEG